MRPMPPRVCAADSHTADGLRRWNLEASGLGVDSGAGLYLREAHATRPAPKYWSVVLDTGRPTPFVPIHEPFELVG
nr:DUF5447 family protein [Stutzerimonas nitrititolerans]